MKELGTLFLATIGTTLGVWNFISNRKKSTKDTTLLPWNRGLEVGAILDRVTDLLGGTNRLRVNRKSVEKDLKPDSELFVEAMETLGFKAKLRKESSR